MPDEKAKGAGSRTTGAVIDRLEEQRMAVLLAGEDEEHSIDLPVALLPDGATDGDHLRITITLDRPSRDSAEERVRQMQERLAKRSGAEGEKNFKL